ncbi:MAG TPA: protein kinase [Thermoanaerobaculia bacterium]|jgi:serine/threonine protein kinase/Tfp pilus assembly protein PilF|nr:protein kinase [Thermoanaerobaculia bacterium]
MYNQTVKPLPQEPEKGTWLIGRTILQYRILERLGAGGMGEVYLAKDLRLRRKVALKFLSPEQAGRPTFLDRFRLEARAAAALQHPNIVTIYAVEEADGLPFLALEFVEGSTLEDLIPPGGMQLDRMLRIAVQLADALRAAHEHGVIHRDIKPRNLMIDSGERLKVLDFGISKRLPAEDQPTLVGGEPTEALTREGQILGTVSYMSPEQLQGLPLDPRSDLFSAGVVLYQMATGRLPLHSSSPAEQMIKMLEERVPLPGVVRAGLPRRFDEIVGRCLERDPRQRYQSARVLRDDLEALARDPVSSPHIPTLPEPPAPRPPLRKLAIGGLLAALVLLAGASGLIRRQPAVRGGPHALAVLPLENLSNEQEYFVDGMTDALIASLCNVGRVRVISRQSVMRFKGSDLALPAIARQLGVDLVLTGSVVRSGLQVRITTNLVQADPEQQLWAETYERDLKDILALQDEVAREVAGQVRLELTDQERSRLSDAKPVDPAAYELYLQGKFQLQKRTQVALAKAVDAFQAATRKDPRYAPAYAGEADARFLLGYFRFEPVEASYAKARAAAAKALDLDPSLAEAHAAMGNLLRYQDWDGPGAEREWQRALALNPNYESVHHWLGNHLSSVGRMAEAGEHLETARRLNPLSPSIHTALAGYFLRLRELDRSAEQAGKAIDLEPGYPVSYEILWAVRHTQGRPDEAFQAYEKALALSGYQEAAEAARRALAKSGYRAALAAAGEALARHPEEAPVSLVASTFALAGENDRALKWLATGVDRHEPFVLWLRQDVEWEGLRGDPRFQRLVERVDDLRPATPPASVQPDQVPESSPSSLSASLSSSSGSAFGSCEGHRNWKLNWKAMLPGNPCCDVVLAPSANALFSPM